MSYEASVTVGIDTYFFESKYAAYRLFLHQRALDKHPILTFIRIK